MVAWRNVKPDDATELGRCLTRPPTSFFLLALFPLLYTTLAFTCQIQ